MNARGDRRTWGWPRLWPVAALSLTMCLPAAAEAQTVSFDFESGLRGWTATGTAFVDQPLRGADLLTDTLQPLPLGGDYWRGLTYPVGHEGTYLVSTSGPGHGRLVSASRTLTSDDRYFSALVGGPQGSVAYLDLQLHTPGQTPEYRSIFKAEGNGRLSLTRRTFTIPSELEGRSVRVVVVDETSAGGISVDDIRFSPAVPDERPSPVWGLGDFHTHPMAHLAFGGLKGTRTIWGSPGGRVQDYERDEELIARDIPRCVPGHNGGHSAEVFINSAEGRFSPRGTFKDLWALLTGRITRHDRHGGPSFRSFPHFRSGAHQQMHVTQIHRAWMGGLRLMVAIAVHNQGVEFLTAKLEGNRVDLSTERQVLDAQVCGMRQMAGMNADWMEIAYSPAQAREIISRGKLAVILGIEMDLLGELTGRDLHGEVEYLWKLGIRQVTPVHAIDNRLGGAAIFQPVYNSLNDLLYREVNLKASELPDPRFFRVAELGCGTSGAPPRGECVEFALTPDQSRAAITRPITSFFRLSPFIVPSRVSAYEGVEGMVNVAGLTDDGRDYLRHLMSRGMVIGTEHMSRRSVHDAYQLIADQLVQRGRRECADLASGAAPAGCFDHAYPLGVSHAHFRAMSLPRQLTRVAAFRASEYEVGDRQTDLLRRTGGIVGQFVSEDPVDLPRTVDPPPFANDCAGSSKSFATSLWYALLRMDWAGVGLATDFAFIPGAAPRFGADACSADASADDPRKERALLPAQYLRQAQTGRVEYRPRNAVDSRDASLIPYRMGRGGRAFDFNVDGFAHYGLLPDLLQDVKNIGLPRRAWEALFSSAESYIRAWEKGLRVADVPVDTAPFSPAPLPCGRP